MPFAAAIGTALATGAAGAIASTAVNYGVKQLTKKNYEPSAADYGSVAGGAVQAGVGAYTAGEQSDAIRAGQAEARAISEAAIKESRDLYDPYIGTGRNALELYSDFQGLNGPEAAQKALEGFQSSPGYQYQVNEGIRAVDAGAAAKGILRSGATLKAETKLGQDLANQDFAAYLTRLSSLSDLGFRGVSNFSNVLSGQATSQQETATSAAGQQASIAGKQGENLGNTLGGIAKNGLYEVGKKGVDGIIDNWGGDSNNGGGYADWSDNSSVQQGGWDVGYGDTSSSSFDPLYY